MNYFLIYFTDDGQTIVEKFSSQLEMENFWKNLKEEEQIEYNCECNFLQYMIKGDIIREED